MHDLTTTKSEPKADQLGLKSLPSMTARRLAEVRPSGLRDECEKALTLMAPVRPEVFAVEFERLLVHYWHGGLTAGEGKVLRSDWLRLLGHIPADLMRTGVDRYLLSTATHKPTPGKFLENIASELGYRQAIADRARDTLALLNAPSPQDKAA